MRSNYVPHRLTLHTVHVYDIEQVFRFTSSLMCAILVAITFQVQKHNIQYLHNLCIIKCLVQCTLFIT